MNQLSQAKNIENFSAGVSSLILAVLQQPHIEHLGTPGTYLNT